MKRTYLSFVGLINKRCRRLTPTLSLPCGKIRSNYLRTRIAEKNRSKFLFFFLKVAINFSQKNDISGRFNISLLCEIGPLFNDERTEMNYIQ